MPLATPKPSLVDLTGIAAVVPATDLASPIALPTVEPAKPSSDTFVSCCAIPTAKLQKIKHHNSNYISQRHLQPLREAIFSYFKN